MSRVDPAKEPEDASFDHASSGRRYKIFRKDGDLWHSEELLVDGEGVVDLSDLEKLKTAEQLEYLVGSGRHSRTFVVERNGFLIESPITWYQSSRTWAMSPGYDQSQHESFERATEFSCLVCHVGSIDSASEQNGQLKIQETAIGCERCHGPGREHVTKWEESSLVGSRDVPDSSIVNPRRLSRDRSESICAQCHLRGDATVLVRGKSLRDFSPGMLLTEVRVDYRLTSNNDAMKVVGHVDQMHASRCFQQSQELSCMTCHDMHRNEHEVSGREFYRRQCLECHQESSCRIPSDQRLREGDNDCVKCHMPQVPTDIPHIAFTHHRIGIHGMSKAEPKESSATAILVPFYPISESLISDKSPGESSRNLALAYLELADKQTSLELAAQYRQMAAEMLQDLLGTEMADGEVYAALARLAWEQDAPNPAIQFSQLALSSTELSSGARMNSLLVAGDSHLQLNQSELAVTELRQLTNLRNRSQDWWLLGIALYQSGSKQEGLAALAKAIAVQPLRSDIRRTYAQILQAEGRNEESTEQQRLAEYLEK